MNIQNKLGQMIKLYVIQIFTSDESLDFRDLCYDMSHLFTEEDEYVTHTSSPCLILYLADDSESIAHSRATSYAQRLNLKEPILRMGQCLNEQTIIGRDRAQRMNEVFLSDEELCIRTC